MHLPRSTAGRIALALLVVFFGPTVVGVIAAVFMPAGMPGAPAWVGALRAPIITAGVLGGVHLLTRTASRRGWLSGWLVLAVETVAAGVGTLLVADDVPTTWSIGTAVSAVATYAIVVCGMDRVGARHRGWLGRWSWWGLLGSSLRQFTTSHQLLGGAALVGGALFALGLAVTGTVGSVWWGLLPPLAATLSGLRAAWTSTNPGAGRVPGPTRYAPSQQDGAGDYQNHQPDPQQGGGWLRPEQTDQNDHHKVVHGGKRIEPLAPGTARQELDGLIGLRETKAEVRDIEIAFRMAQIRASKGVEVDENESRHLVMVGPPGVGKTVTARIIGALYRDLGALKSGHIIACIPADIRGEYIGHAGAKAKSACEDALDGVLFVDEAYSLKDDAFGIQALETIMAFAEDNRDRLVVILAGYPQQMEELLQVNPGLPSRFPTTIHFPAYSLDELVAIADVLSTSKGWVLADDAKDTIRVVTEQRMREASWSNARSIRILIEAARRRLNRRMHAAPQAEHTPDNLRTIRAADIDVTALTEATGPHPGEPVEQRGYNPFLDSADARAGV